MGGNRYLCVVCEVVGWMPWDWWYLTVISEEHLILVRWRSLIALCLSKRSMLLAHLSTLVAIIVLHIDKLHVQIHLRAHRTSPREICQLMVLAKAKLVGSRKLRCWTLIVCSERVLNLIGCQLTEILQIVPRSQWYVISWRIDHGLLVDGYRLHRPLLGIL